MYGDALIHRLGILVGCLGLATLMPYGALPVPVAVLLSFLPMAIFEIGAAIVDQGEERGSRPLRGAGWHMQVYAAILFVAPFAVFAIQSVRFGHPAALLYTGVAACGLPTSLIVIMRGRHLLRGKDPRPAARNATPPGRKPGLVELPGRIISEPLLLGGLGLIAASAAAYLQLGGQVTTAREVIFVFGLLLAPVLLGVASSVEGRGSAARSTGLEVVERALESFVVLGGSGVLLATAIVWGGAPEIRLAMAIGGAVILLVALFAGIRRLARPLPPPEEEKAEQ